MRKVNSVRTVYLLATVTSGLLAGSVLAEGYGKDNYPGTQPATQPGQEQQASGQAQQQPPMDAMQQQMMANMAAYAATGPEHDHLKRRLGQWEHTATMWPHPGAEPVVTHGQTVTELIMGGRFLLDRSTGEFFGQQFEGMGITGYDRIKKKYTGIWIDNMGTGIYSVEGEPDDSGNVVTYSSNYSCTMTGTVKQGKSVETTIDADHWKLEMYDTTPAGQEFKAFQIEYKRPG